MTPTLGLLKAVRDVLTVDTARSWYAIKLPPVVDLAARDLPVGVVEVVDVPVLAEGLSGPGAWSVVLQLTSVGRQSDTLLLADRARATVYDQLTSGAWRVPILVVTPTKVLQATSRRHVLSSSDTGSDAVHSQVERVELHLS